MTIGQEGSEEAPISVTVSSIAKGDVQGAIRDTTSATFMATATESAVAPRGRVVMLSALGWSIRNFLYNPGFQSFLETNDVHFWSPAWRDLEDRKEVRDLAQFADLKSASPSGARARAIKWVRFYYTFRFNSASLRRKLELGKDGARAHRPVRLLYYLSEQSARLANRFVPLRWAERLERWGGAIDSTLVAEYERRLALIGPDLVVSTCPQSYFMEWPPVIAAVRLGIPVVAQILSWDNLTTKGHFAADFDRYLVWSDIMGRELQRDYGVDPRQIVATGPPNFDFYFCDQFVETREAFASRHGLDAKHPIILYGGVTPGLMPNDHEVCRIVLEAIRQRKLTPAAQVLVRVHPKDPGERWRNLALSYPELKICISNIAHGDVRAWAPGAETLREQVSCVRHGDVHLNVVSTLTLDACIADRPTINVAFDPTDAHFSSVVASYYEMEHYRPALDLGAAVVAWSADELIGLIKEYLRDGSRGRVKRAELVKLQLGRVDGHAAERIGEALNDLILERRS